MADQPSGVATGQGAEPLRIRPEGASSGFSLVELLVVIGIIVILAVVTLPAMRNISGGTGLTSAAEEFVGTVNLARQRASTFNRQVAIRFWKDGTNFSSCQLWEQKDSSDPGSWSTAEREKNFPLGVVITNSDTYSSLLSRAGNSGATNGRDYVDAFFTPSGALVATPAETSITFIQANGPATGGTVSGLPPNFATVVIEPLNGTPRLYRP